MMLSNYFLIFWLFSFGNFFLIYKQPRPVSTLLKGLIRWLVHIHYNPKAITKTECSTLILNKREPVLRCMIANLQAATTDSLLFNIRVEYSVLVVTFGLWWIWTSHLMRPLSKVETGRGCLFDPIHNRLEIIVYYILASDYDLKKNRNPYRIEFL